MRHSDLYLVTKSKRVRCGRDCIRHDTRLRRRRLLGALAEQEDLEHRPAAEILLASDHVPYRQ